MTVTPRSSRRAAAAAVAALLLAASAASATPTAADLDAYEARVRAAPDDLFLGADYRQAVIELEAYDRAIAFFEELVAAHPASANAVLNLGYAYVDKIPSAGAITQVILANTALGHFTRALELEETWLVRFTRGNSYLYWPAIFGRAPAGIADLERALDLADEAGTARPYHARAWAALGDGHWRLGDLDAARKVWERGKERFPDDPGLAARLAREGEELDHYLEEHFATGNRVATHLREMREGTGEAR